MKEEKRNAFDEFSFAALSALGSLMACNEVCRNQRAVMKINRFRAWLMDLKPQDNPEPTSPFDCEPTSPFDCEPTSPFDCEPTSPFDCEPQNRQPNNN